MDRIRIGKDIRINWEISASDESIILSQDNLTLEITTPSNCIANLPFTFNNGTLTANFYGIDQTQIGNYWLTVWYNRGIVGQSALDKVLAFQLVRSTEEETHNDESIAYAEVSLSGTIEINGGTNLHYYSEDLQKKEAKIDNGYSSLVFDDDDDGSINFNAAHSQITDDNGNHIIVGSMSINGKSCGVHVQTSGNEKFLHNNNEVATKNDLPQYEFESMSQEDYDALVDKDDNTLYFITQ